MRQNPFSIFDFLGYVFPGALALVIIAFFEQLPQLTSLSKVFEEAVVFIKGQNSSGTLGVLEETVIMTIISYVIGHIVAYLSSITVEKYSNWLFGYPSQFLLKELPKWYYWRISKECRTQDSPLKKPVGFAEWTGLFWRVLIGLFLLPLSICSITLGKFLNVKSFFVKPLDSTLKDAINNNVEKLKNSLGVTYSEGDDIHRIIYHYEYEHQPAHTSKMDNYVALYGFLRSMTFISNSASLWILIKYLLPSLRYFSNGIDWHYVLIFIISFGLTYIFFMAFMKFYRRFTLESFMCLVIDDSYKVTIKAPVAFQITPTNQDVDSNYNVPENSSTTGPLTQREGTVPNQQYSDTNTQDDDELSTNE